MNVVGLITEYNPFHNGHLYHIKEAKRITQADFVVVVMSGNYVQRGAPSIVDKYTRTRMALSCGADLVIELPSYYSTASAEFFAFGAVATLHALGFVTSICFGSECGEIELLQTIATLLQEEPLLYQQYLQNELKKGSSFPVARVAALLSYCSEHYGSTFAEQIQECIQSPNNILGIEYLKALATLHSPIVPYTIKRIVNNYHSTTISAPISSATSIRSSLLSGQQMQDSEYTIPNAALPFWRKALGQTLPITENDFSLLLYYKLTQNTEDSLTRYLDINKDFSKRIYNTLETYTTFQEYCAKLKSKNVTYTRISRSLFHILLNITDSLYDDCNLLEAVPYLRILGLKKEASHLLRKKGNNFCAPVITKVADAPNLLSSTALNAFTLDLQNTHLYNQVVYHKFGHSIKDEYRHGIIII